MSKATIQTTVRNFIARKKIHPDPDQPRKVFNEAKLEELRMSFGAEPGGIHTDLLVRPHPKKDGEFMLVAGERRWRAAGLDVEMDGADLKPFEELPCRIVSDEEASEARKMQLTENMQRENMSALEEAAGAQRMLEERREVNPKFSKTELGVELGMGRASIYELLSLLELSPVLSKALKAGEINPSQAARIASVPMPEAQLDCLEWLRRCVQYGRPQSVRDLQEYIASNHVKSLEGAPFKLDLVYEGKRIVPFSCDDCPHRSGNQPNWPNGKDKNSCLRPECYRAKALAHAAADGAECIEPKLFDQNRSDYVLPDEHVNTHSHGLIPAKKCVSKKNMPRAIVTQDSSGEVLDVWLMSEWKVAAAADGVTVDAPEQPPEPKKEKKVKAEMSEEEKEAFFEEQRKEEKQRELRRKEEEKLQRDREENARAEELREKVIEAVKPTFREKLAKVPEKTVLLFVLDALAEEARDVAGLRKIKSLDKCDAGELRSVLYEVALQCSIGEFWTNGGDYEVEFKAACKLVGIDLKAEEKKLAPKEEKQGELIPPTKGKSKPAKKKGAKKK